MTKNKIQIVVIATLLVIITFLLCRVVNLKNEEHYIYFPCHGHLTTSSNMIMHGITLKKPSYCTEKYQRILHIPYETTNILITENIFDYVESRPIIKN